MNELTITSEDFSPTGQIKKEILNQLHRRHIKKLVIKDCTGGISLKNLPLIVGELFIENCATITSLPEKIIKLDVRNCPDLTSLPVLPSEIRELNLIGCGLVSLQLLPLGLTTLSLADCSKLESLEDLPVSMPVVGIQGITFINMAGCLNLVFSPKLTERLQTLEVNGADISYPEHYRPNPESLRLEKILEDAIEAYLEPYRDKQLLLPETKLPETDNIKQLVIRYLNEQIIQRGGWEKIVADITPILDELRLYPEHLAFVEEIAAEYLGACINQPVGGLSEIAAMLAIARAGREAISKEAAICDKIAAAKHLLALEAITNYVASLPKNQKPGAAIEIEAGNALFREVHKKLLDNRDILEPWLGVPGSIAYERTITNWLNLPTWSNLPYRLIKGLFCLNRPGKVEEAYEKAKEIVAQDPVKILDYLCNTRHLAVFAEVVFPEKLAEIKEKYQELQEVLGKEEAKLSENLEELASAESKVQEETKTQTESSETLFVVSEQELQNRLNQKQEELRLLGFKLHTEIATEIRALGIEALMVCGLLAAEEKKGNADRIELLALLNIPKPENHTTNLVIKATISTQLFTAQREEEISCV
jgi:hypothetical protein